MTNNNLNKPFEKEFANLRTSWNGVIDTLFGIDKEAVRKTLDETFSLIHSMQNELAHLSDDNSFDALTGVYTRTYFSEYLKTLTPSPEYPVTIVAGDADNLKLTNDIFGHSAGDELLITITDIMKRCGKDTYVIGRCGGDEFNVILPGVDAEEGQHYCELIKNACVDYDGNYLPPSISLGVKTNYGEIGLFTTLQEAEELMYRNKTIVKSKQNIFTDVMELLYKRGLLDKENQERLVDYIEKFANYLKLDPQTTSNLCLAARINDIGFIALPHDIIQKGTKRTKEDLNTLTKHCEIGYRIAKLYDQSFPVANIILHHHESYDGTGYPYHLKGDEILYTAHILSLVSTFTYWCAPKPMGSGLTLQASYERLIDRAGTQFNPVLLRQFKTFLEEEILPNYT
ncbi:MAG: diguanylate cyclase [Lachnospiraceae bacterium]|nr:diguanylate cyclase [Lachnospiraceae bacterium]